MYWFAFQSKNQRRWFVTLAMTLVLLGLVLFLRTDQQTSAAVPDAIASDPIPMLQVIVRGEGESADLAAAIMQHGGTVMSELALIESVVAEVPADQIHALANDSRVQQVTLDAPVHGREELYTAALNSDIIVTGSELPHQVYVPFVTVSADSASNQQRTTVETDQQLAAQSPAHAIYTDSIANPWRLTEWAEIDLASTAGSHPVEGQAMAVTFSQGWDGLMLSPNSAELIANYDTLSFWLHGGDAGGQTMWLRGDGSSDWASSSVMLSAEADQWNYYEIPLSSLTTSGEINGLIWQNMRGSAQPTFYLDNVQLVRQGGDSAETGRSSIQNGLNYRYYYGYWQSVPEFDFYTPRYQGVHNNINLDVRNRNQFFGVDFNGYLFVPQDGVYTFYLTSDEGSKLWINNQLVVDNDGLHAATELSGSITLESGFHAIEVGYFQLYGANTLSLEYAGPSITRQPLPDSALYASDPVAVDGRGGIMREWWVNVTGGEIQSLTSHVNYPGYPAGTAYPTSFETPLDWGVDYGSRMRGYLYPPVDGYYRFWVSGDDNSELWLSSSENPANRSLIAYSNQVSWRDWDAQPNQQSALIYLTSDQRYYIEGLQKDSSGGDHLSVAWQIPNGVRELINGDYLSPLIPQAGDVNNIDPLGYLRALDIDDVQDAGVMGNGVNVAYLDTGVNPTIVNTTFSNWLVNIGGEDPNGHGTLMAAIGHSNEVIDGQMLGVAPNANVMSYARLDETGKGSYSAVVSGLDLIALQDVDVVNLSLQGPVLGPYWQNPLNQAVEALWEDGVVVIVAAGNTGPFAGSITTPGNDPLVITVGAYTDHYSPLELADDYIPPFSATGPTEMGFVKPDLVAPGAHLLAPLHATSAFALDPATTQTADGYYVSSGTSAAAAFTSGVVALMLEKNPDLTPDEVKYRLLSTADPIVQSGSDGDTTFSIFQQGTGRIDPYQAVFANINGAANVGMEAGGTYLGPTVYDEERQGYVLVDEHRNPLPVGADYFWDGGWAYSGGWAFSGSWTWSGGWAFSGSWTWSGGWAFSGTYFSNSNYYWNTTHYWSGSYYWSGNDYWIGVTHSRD